MGGRPPLGETEVPGNHTEVAVRQLQECAKCHCYLFTLKWLIVCEVSFLSIFLKRRWMPAPPGQSRLPAPTRSLRPGRILCPPPAQPPAPTTGLLVGEK